MTTTHEPTALRMRSTDDPRVLAAAASEDYSLHVVPRGDCAANGVSGPIRRAEVRRDGHCE